jgi:hypothetical protein
MKRPFLGVGLLFLGSALVCAAQSSTSSSGPSSGSSGQQDSAKAQAVPQAPGKPADQSADETKKKPKKVWTNEEMNSVKGDVSVVGDPPSVSQSPCSPASPRSGCSASTSAKPSSYDRLVDSYLRQLSPLRSNLADIDRKIQKAKEAKGNSSEDTAAYLRVYADKRGDVQAKIDAILENARQHGVAPGDLR